jgi:hypothetical protein
VYDLLCVTKTIHYQTIPYTTTPTTPRAITGLSVGAEGATACRLRWEPVRSRGRHEARLIEVCVCVCVLCCAVLCYAMLCYVCYAVLCYAVLCYAVICYAMLCYAMVCCAMLLVLYRHIYLTPRPTIPTHQHTNTLTHHTPHTNTHQVHMSVLGSSSVAAGPAPPRGGSSSSSSSSSSMPPPAPARSESYELSSDEEEEVSGVWGFCCTIYTIYPIHT